jgi:hypothetical protein
MLSCKAEERMNKGEVQEHRFFPKQPGRHGKKDY